MISSFLLKEQIFAILRMIIPYIVVKMTLNYIGGSKIWHGNFIKMVQRIFDESKSKKVSIYDFW